MPCESRDNALVVVAHPDDEVLGCGGTMWMLRNQYNFHCLILGEPACLELVKEQREVASILEFQQCFDTRHYPDEEFDTVPLVHIIRKIERVMIEYRPHMIFTHSYKDLNRDHQIVGEACRVACRPHIFGGSLFYMEIPSSSELGFTPFVPTVFTALDLDGSTKKLDAIRCYASQWHNRSEYPRSEDKLIALMKYRGAQAGCQYAEAFESGRHYLGQSAANLDRRLELDDGMSEPSGNNGVVSTK